MEKIPQDSAELGAALRRLRGSSSLRTLAARDPSGSVSKSTLGRFEIGSHIPPLRLAETLDHVYDANGWLSLAIRSLRASRWDPWRETDLPSISHSGGWPAEYSGDVWIRVIPNVRAAGREHALSLRWGPWVNNLRLELPPDGISLVTGKDIDRNEVPVTCQLSSQLPVFAVYGASVPLPTETSMDIRTRWVLSPT